MTLKLVGLALIPTLLGSTAVFAQDDTPHFALSATAGVTALNMPSGQNGVLWGGDAKASGTNGQLLIGETFSLSTAVDLGSVGDYDAFMGANIFGTYANGSSASTQNFSGIGYVAVPGLSTPDNASITLTTTRGPGAATATAVVDETDPQGHHYTSNPSGATSTNGSGGESGSNVSTGGGTPDSFAMSGLNTNVPAVGASSALAYGGIADTSGSIFIASGDLDGLSVSTKTRNTVLYAGADITFGAGHAYDDKTSVQAYVGPSYRYIGQWNSTNTGLSVDVPEISGTITHPLYVDNRDAAVTSNYIGGVIGANVSHKVNDTLALSFGAEGSLYYANANLKGRETVRTYGGLSHLGVASPDVTVVEDAVNTSQSQLAYAVRGQTSATIALTPSVDLIASATADYLSAVARPGGAANIQDNGNGNVSWKSGGPHISFDGMFAFGGSLSLNGHF